MCYHTKLINTADDIEEYFRVEFVGDSVFDTGEDINAFSYPNLPVYLGNELDVFQWGLKPSWAKENFDARYTLNARIETLREKNSFKNSIMNRCLIVVNGFYEWKHLDHGKKQKYFIQLEQQNIFTLGCIFSIWKNQPTFSIVTKEANELMSEIHNTKKRMPVVVPNEFQDDWLHNPNIEDYMKIDVSLTAQEVF